MKTICEWSKCNNLGEFKAPVEKDNSKKYRMLCFRSMLKNLIRTGIIFQA